MSATICDVGRHAQPPEPDGMAHIGWYEGACPLCGEWLVVTMTSLYVDWWEKYTDEDVH